MWIINYFTDWLKGSNDYFWTATSDVMAKSTDKKKKYFLRDAPATSDGSH